jgi:L-lactate dehydrogenase complex protein LldE
VVFPDARVRTPGEAAGHELEEADTARERDMGYDSDEIRRGIGVVLGRHIARSREHPTGKECGGTSVVRVALFITCFSDTLFPETGIATVRLLERLGHQVEFPLEQTCCGQMHFNTGYQREAIPLVRRFVEVFSSYEAVVAPSGSCVGMVRELYPMAARLANDERLERRIEEFAPKVFELSEFLVKKLGITGVGAYYPHRVTYHPTCHSLRMLGVGDAPLELLRDVRGIDLVELPEAKECCGFGGTFAVKNADTSAAMLSDKIRHVLDTEAEVCTAGDNSCLMHIGGGLRRQRAGVRTVHLAEILASTEER